MFGRRKRPNALRRIQQFWLCGFLALVAVGTWLGPRGFGRSRWALAAFALAFVVASVRVALRALGALRPGVQLVDSLRPSAEPERIVAEHWAVAKEANIRPGGGAIS
jgi:hypothetical protein